MSPKGTTAGPEQIRQPGGLPEGAVRAAPVAGLVWRRCLVQTGGFPGLPQHGPDWP